MGAVMRELSSKPHTGYVEVADALSADIRSGRYAPDSPFPSVTAIMRRFGVSRVTASHAMAELKRRGVVVGLPGAATTVRNRTVGLIFPGIAYAESFQQIMAGLARCCQREGWKMAFAEAFSDDPRKRAQEARTLAETFVYQHVVGAIFQPVSLTDDAVETNRRIASGFEKAGIPLILLDNDIVPPPERSAHDLVGVNNFEAGRRIAAHLVEVGARRVSFLLHRNAAPSVKLRRDGVATLLADTPGVAFRDLVSEPDDTDAVSRFLRAWRPDAFVCANDKSAAILMHSLRALGRRIPEDILMAGFDNIQIAYVTTPSLTTVRQPCAEIAETAIKALAERIANPSLLPREIFLPAPLVVRESTKRNVLPGKYRTKEKRK